MPLAGPMSNLKNLTADSIEEFRNNITPKKTLIVASGVSDHDNFVELVKSNTASIQPVQEHLYQRQPGKYVGGSTRTFVDSEHTNVILGFESTPWNHPDSTIYFVMNTLLGQASVFSSGGPGKGMYCRAITQLM